MANVVKRRLKKLAQEAVDEGYVLPKGLTVADWQRAATAQAHAYLLGLHHYRDGVRRRYARRICFALTTLIGEIGPLETEPLEWTLDPGRDELLEWAREQHAQAALFGTGRGQRRAARAVGAFGRFICNVERVNPIGRALASASEARTRPADAYAEREGTSSRVISENETGVGTRVVSGDENQKCSEVEEGAAPRTRRPGAYAPPTRERAARDGGGEIGAADFGD